MLGRWWTVLRERCAQLVNRGYCDRAELDALLKAIGQATGGGEQALRRSAKQWCSGRLSIGLLIR
jgi:hypothetical protein